MDLLHKLQSDKAVGSFSLLLATLGSLHDKLLGLAPWLGLLRRSSTPNNQSLHLKGTLDLKLQPVLVLRAWRGYGARMLIPNMRVCFSTGNLCKVQPETCLCLQRAHLPWWAKLPSHSRLSLLLNKIPERSVLHAGLVRLELAGFCPRDSSWLWFSCVSGQHPGDSLPYFLLKLAAKL